ncbi:MFS transporter [Microtetraspora malaysiensis]|uniref:MFS transporter n=1 Tax=Microtetraspora malaysiensis TaxID=161358 RepID=UPI003D95026F
MLTNPTQPTATSRTRVVAAGAVGTTLEWYDFSVYAALATWIAAGFFPADNPGVSLLSALAVFGVGFLFRPLGAVVFGHIGDRYGRKEALGLTIIVMGLSTALLAIAPTYAAAGVLGPVVLLVARCGQGFSSGGEFAGGASFLIEHAPEGRRGLYGAIHYMALIGGNLIGAGIVAALSFSLSEEQMQTWGWRVPFVIGTVAAFAGVYIRRRLGDTPVMEGARKQDDIARSPFAEALRTDGRAVLRGIGLVVGFTVMSYTYVNMQSFIVTVSDLSQGAAVALYSLSLVVQLCLIGLFGRLSDRIGRKPVLIAGATLMVATTYPSFLLISSGSTIVILAGLTLMAVSIAVYAGPFTTVITELMSRRTRFTALAVSYGFAVAVFGGTAGFVVAWLRQELDSVFAPALFGTVAAVITLATTLTTRETRLVRLED